MLYSRGGLGGLAAGVGGATMSAFHTMLMLNVIGLVNQLPAVIGRLCRRVRLWWFREVQIAIPEQGREWHMYNRVFSAVETYLGTMSAERALRLKATGGDGAGCGLVLTMDDAEGITDEFFVEEEEEDGGKRKRRAARRGIKVRWSYYCPQVEKGEGLLWNNERKYYTLTFDARHRAEVVKQYLAQVMARSRELEMRNRQRKLFTNSMGGDRLWTQVVFKHPATFATLAMDAKKKQEIMDDLEAFSKSQDYYAKTGKTWKRGYLLHGPPGTGKSTMIACMANFLDYDVYDLELTAVRDNTDLRRLIVNSSARSIIVIEDIDCSLRLSPRAPSKSSPPSDQENVEEFSDVGAGEEKAKKKLKNPEEAEKRKEARGESKLTLSGLLNFIDGLWSACGGERLIVFTTNHIEKLDPALIRRGRMDVHVELGYCDFEAFKVLANNYLAVEEHPQFAEVEELLAAVEVSPADVAEHLMPKNLRAKDKAGRCLDDLVGALKKSKEEKMRKKMEEDEKSDHTGQLMTLIN